MVLDKLAGSDHHAKVCTFFFLGEAKRRGQEVEGFKELFHTDEVLLLRGEYYLIKAVAVVRQGKVIFLYGDDEFRSEVGKECYTGGSS